ncbi:gamma-aminobutyric acid type B receptor subunit 1-like [Acanthaster planci]|uniref:Gamma-aminobutyric acid type B receptor subunit 2 n=1 Tax=Acanthaster planci TaxID=133434 RepID=A0A8B7YAL7_ACAPL|nr:gamma-aminobutyric acid type B receptor subunit 1-like [Acanthaster planci]
MLSLFFRLTILGTACVCMPNVTKLYLLGLYPESGPWVGAQTAIPATQLAVTDINSNPDILPRHQIVVIPRDTECDGGKATDEMYRELFNKTTTKVMVIGAGCSIATEPTAQASHYWNLIQISYASSSPKLSTRSLFPRFFRLYPPGNMFNIAKLALIREFNWKKVATLHQSVAIFSLAFAEFHRDAKRAGIEVIAAESFIEDPTEQVEFLKHSGARIIVAGFYGDGARKVYCEAYHQKMYGAKYVWIVPGWITLNIWLVPDDSVDCSLDQLREVAGGQIGINAVSLPPDSQRAPALSGMTTSKFLERFKETVGSDNPESLPGYSEMPFSYDTIWTAALALHEADKQLGNLDPPRTLANFTYEDSVTVQILFDIISNMSFQGISGPVKFTPSGDRLGLIQIWQLQDNRHVNVGVMDPGTSEDITWEGYESIRWEGGAPPVDFVIEFEDRQTIRSAVFISGAIFATFGIILACCFLIFNIHFKNRRMIKMSSPNINNLMLIGGMLAYVSIIFQGVDTAIASTDTFLSMCKAKTWCLSTGFSLAFGSMFCKTWRVHKIFTNKTAMRMVLKDHRLLIWVAVLVLLDIVILILWEILDPLVAVERLGAKVVDNENDDVVYTPIRLFCESRNQIYWIGTFYIIDGLLLIFGAFLAWETRKVSIPALNDSKYIGICVYNVLIMSLTGAPMSFVLEERNVHYAAVATLIWLTTTLTLCVVFVPKVRARNVVQPRSHQSEQPADVEREMQRLRQELDRMKARLEIN